MRKFLGLFFSIFLLLTYPSFAGDIQIDGRDYSKTDVQEFEGINPPPGNSSTGHATMYYDLLEQNLKVSKEGGEYAILAGGSGGNGTITGLTPGKFTISSTDTTVANSIMSQSGTLVTLAGSMTVTGQGTFSQVNAALNGNATTASNALQWNGSSTNLVPTTGRTSLELGSASTLDSTAFLGASAKAADSDLLDGHDTAYFQTAGSYLTGVTADSPLSGSGTSGSHLVLSTAGTWSGNAATATLASGSTTTQSDNVWTSHQNYPADCPTGQYAYGVGDTLSCRADQTGGGGSISGLTPGKFTIASTDTTIADSIMSQASTLVTLAGSMTVTGQGTFSTVNAALNGNATTATNLASDPTDCPTSQYAQTIGANGNLTCKAVSQNEIDLSLYATTAALALKAPLASPTFTGLISGASMTLSGDATFSAGVTLGGVRNTAWPTSGVTMPLAYLTVTGSSTLSGDVTIGAASTTYFTSGADLGVKGNITADGSIYVLSTGNVGIGTTTMPQKLSIDGGIYWTNAGTGAHGTAKHICLGVDGVLYGISSGNCF